MKKFKMLMMIWALSMPVMAQDYYSPTDRQKEPVARFPFKTKPEIRTEPNGQKYIMYTLPEMLTGERNEISATAVNVPGDLGVQMFTGPHATLTCMGTDKNPGCMVTHRNLRFNQAKALAIVNDTYYDPQLRLDAANVVREFQSLEHSSNQPIGVIGALKDIEVSNFPSATMESYFVRPSGGFNRATITWVLKKDQNNKDEVIGGAFVLRNNNDDGSEGTLSRVKQFGNRVRGVWSVGGKSGWFDFDFSSDRTRFDGTFGDYERNIQDLTRHIKAGVWNSGRP